MSGECDGCSGSAKGADELPVLEIQGGANFFKLKTHSVTASVPVGMRCFLCGLHFSILIGTAMIEVLVDWAD